MPIYKGSQKISSVFYGNQKIGKIYKGSQLLYSSLAYPLDTVLFESSTAGTSTLSLEEGIYEVYCIGGGGGGWGRRGVASGGGSGSGFIGQINISKGNYEIMVGTGGAGGAVSGKTGGNSTIGDIVKTFGGSGSGNYPSGGAIPEISVTILSTTLNSAGNSGNHNSSSTGIVSAAGGASLYNGYGAGGLANRSGGKSGTAGYVKIVYKGN